VTSDWLIQTSFINSVYELVWRTISTSTPWYDARSNIVNGTRNSLGLSPQYIMVVINVGLMVPSHLRINMRPLGRNDLFYYLSESGGALLQDNYKLRCIANGLWL